MAEAFEEAADAIRRQLDSLKADLEYCKRIESVQQQINAACTQSRYTVDVFLKAHNESICLGDRLGRLVEARAKMLIEEILREELWSIKQRISQIQIIDQPPAPATQSTGRKRRVELPEPDA